MSRSLSWIDPDEVKKHLSRAATPPGRRSSGPDDHVHFPPSSTPSASPPTALPQPTMVEPAPGPTMVAAAPSAPSSDIPRFPPSMNLAERVAAVARWIEDAAAPSAYYIADEQGLPIHAEGVEETQVVAAVALARAIRPLRGFLGTDRVDAATLHLDDGRTLHTVWIDTRMGRIAAGLELRDALAADLLRDVREAVRRVFDW